MTVTEDDLKAIRAERLAADRQKLIEWAAEEGRELARQDRRAGTGHETPSN